MTKEKFKEIQKELDLKGKDMARICGTSRSMIIQIRGGFKVISRRVKNILFLYKLLNETQKKEFHKSIDLNH